ncbi:MAG TPA: NADPH-dependent FMN reductase [Mucilaginibacter sp.]|jgi:NAD(P)H-dependent FMN reductase
MAPAGIEYSIYDGLAQIPHFDPGLDNDNPPATVAEFRKLLADAHAVIICTPEYAYGVPGTLKNALDWTVSSGSLDGKTMALITASTAAKMPMRLCC